MSKTGLRHIRWLFDTIINPQRLVQSSSAEYQGSLLLRLKIAVVTTLFFTLNVVLYAFPLAIAEVGFVNDKSAPDIFENATRAIVENPDAAWTILSRLANNAIVLLAIGGITFLVYHFGVYLTRNSNGIVLSYRIITINTSIYLAALFNLGWVAISETQTLSSALQWGIRRHFGAIAMILSKESPFQSANKPPELSHLTGLEKILVVSLLVSLCYYLYIIYLGCRKMHGTTRYEALLVIGVVLMAPVFYAAITIIIGSILNLPSVFTFGINN